MDSYLETAAPGSSKKVTITKARFGDISKALDLGAAYSFDRESYERFRPLARKCGMDAGPNDFDETGAKGIQFVRVQKGRFT
jgi:hypothetical protein